jgi:hypothetical protein
VVFSLAIRLVTIRMDSRFPGYMRIRVSYPLIKPLMLELKIKINDRGIMNIML